MLYANLFNAEFEKLTLGHVAAHGTASSASVYAHTQLRLCQSASQRNLLVILQLRRLK